MASTIVNGKDEKMKFWKVVVSKKDEKMKGCSFRKDEKMKR